MAEAGPSVTFRDRRKEEQERQRLVKQYQYFSPVESPNHNFCARCKIVNFQAIFQFIASRQDLEPTPVAVFGSIHRHMLDSACPCCSFLAQLVFLNKDYPWDEATDCYLLAETSRRPDSNATSEDRVGACHRCLKLQFSGPSLKPGETWRLGPLAEHLIFPAGRGIGSAWAFQDGTACARCIDRDELNFEDIVRCLQQCQMEHALCARATPSQPIDAIVIDCQSDPPNLVHGSTAMQFVALSYCLGTIQPKITASAGGNGRYLDMASVPQTIKDAIIVTSKLRRRYLWVDAICIAQEDAAVKKTLINQMDRIYSYADVVLVALGEDVHSGLHGVSVPRTSQSVLKVGTRTLVSKMSDLRDVLQKSRYSTRCWTYQEALLARRCVFFTPEQWHYVCQTSSACEILTETLPQHVGTRLDIYALRSTLFRLRGTNKHDLEITEDIREYTVRDLSLDSDFLNAFNGVLRRSGLFSLCGVVSLPQGDSITVASLETGFAFGLFWAGQDRSFARTQGAPRTSRRHGFPTWSWLSSRGVVDMTWSNPRDFISDFSRVDIHASFSVKDEEEGSESLAAVWLAMPDQVAGSKALGLDDSQDLQITSYAMKARFIRPTQPIMLAEYWLDLGGPVSILVGDGLDSTVNRLSTVYSATLQFTTGEHRSIEDHEDILFDKEAFFDTTLRERILTEEFELLLLVSHAFEGRQLNYWLILDQEGNSRKRIGTVRCIGRRYEGDDHKQQHESRPRLHQISAIPLPQDYVLLSKATVTMV